MSSQPAHKFQVGDRARIVMQTSRWRGQIVTITDVVVGRRFLNVMSDGSREGPRFAPVLYVVDLPPPPDLPHDATAVFEPHDLEPVGDCYDAARWADGVWRPTEVHA